jgi:hypothetical protein
LPFGGESCPKGQGHQQYALGGKRYEIVFTFGYSEMFKKNEKITICQG